MLRSPNLIVRSLQQQNNKRSMDNIAKPLKPIVRNQSLVNSRVKKHVISPRRQLNLTSTQSDNLMQSPQKLAKLKSFKLESFENIEQYEQSPILKKFNYKVDSQLFIIRQEQKEVAYRQKLEIHEIETRRAEFLQNIIDYDE
ncbi:hypothetical protein SS50377_27409 [Spironucleus salmonicida]|uniref:Uncharacterized protein n=1 Tax=Spironucleus salmonicida TaxID=348837 RepID=V6LHX1_9EUKA|nr:hypothetical protein SS50377_27409 [Spironucleus salmonicida]|eukprot:EST43301.1 Hypothetical protein SS50377_16968 [Spironucleus salmonicida]